ncbi:MAG: MFS transporter [Chthoniobacterales bacterium]
MKVAPGRRGWLNRTVLGIGLASLFSDWSHEIASAALPAFLATIGVGAAWLGLIEGISDGLSSVAKMASGYYTDRLTRRKPIAVAGYIVTALGTAALGAATSAWHVLVGRSSAWFGRGVRTPVRKALLAAAVDRNAYGRAFGLERAMDTLGAIIGPLSAVFILQISHHNYRLLFTSTLVPGLIAPAVIAFLVVERRRAPVPHISFGERLRLLPLIYRKFVLAVGLFGAGDFAHTLLILLATQKLSAQLGIARAATIAVSLYVLHNVFYAGFSFFAGWLADRLPKKLLLATGYSLAGAMALGIIFLAANVWTLALIFVLGGVYIAMEETLEDSLCAELVEENHHGMAFGVLASVNGVGDLISSIVVGALWSAAGTSIAFTYSAVLFFAGALLVAWLPVTERAR